MNDISLKFTLRTDFTNTNGLFPVYLRAHHNKVQYRVKLPIKINPENWIDSKQRVSTKECGHWDINTKLDFYDTQARNYIFNCQIRKIVFSVEGLKNTLFGKTCSDDFFEFAKSEIDADASLSKETKRTYLAKMSKLRKFRNKLRISEVNYSFLMEYRNYMILIGNDESTMNKDFAIIKSFLNRALKKDLIEKHDFDKIKIKTIEGNREFLSKEELQKLRELYKSPQLSAKHKNVLRLFLFTCYTGLRYSDLKNLTFDNIVDGFIVLKMHKTKKPVEIPLIDEAINLLPTKKEKLNFVFRVCCNQVFNRYIKEITKMVHINKNISHHCARHTFATLAFENGMKIEIISKILGHSSTKITMTYAKILQQQKLEAMKEFNRMLQED